MIAEKVVAIIASAAKRTPVPVTADSNFADLGLDSLDALNVLHELEKEFDVRFPNEEVMNIRSVSQVIERLEKFLACSVPET